MSTARELYNGVAQAHKAWEKVYDLPIAKSDKKKSPKDLTKKEWNKIESAAYDKQLRKERALYNYLKKHGLDMSAEKFGQIAWDSVDDYSMKSNVGKKAKSKMNTILAAIGKNEPKTKTKYKLPSTSQLFKGCGRR